jgi:hypothetical protein
MQPEGLCDHPDDNTTPSTNIVIPGATELPQLQPQLTLFRSDRASLPAPVTSHRTTSR